MRESVEFLRKNYSNWQERKVEEWDRIKQEEKKDRLAVVAMKKKRYGAKMAKLSKEESSKIRMRTEERKELALIRKNLWRKFREVEEIEFEEEEKLAWERISDCLENDDEKEDWTEFRVDPDLIKLKLQKRNCLGTRTTETDNDNSAAVDDEGSRDPKKRTYNSENDGAEPKVFEGFVDNLKTMTHINRQDTPNYILQTAKHDKDPPVTKIPGGGLVTNLVKKFEVWGPDHDRIFRFGENPVLESPRKRPRRENTPPPPPPTPGGNPAHNLAHNLNSKSPWRTRQLRTPTRRTPKHGRHMARTSSPSISKWSSSSAQVSWTTSGVAHPPQTDTTDSSSRHPPDQFHQTPGRHQPLEGPGLANHHGRPLHHRHNHPQHHTKIRNIVRNINYKVEESKKKKEEKESKHPKTIKKKEIDDEIPVRKTKEPKPSEENLEEDPESVQFQYSSKFSYLQDPGPGTRARCPKTSLRKTSAGVQPSCSSPSSSGIMDDMKGFHRSSGEGGGETGDRKLEGLISEQNLGADYFDTCSCSTAATHRRGTVLAGTTIFSNDTKGGKTTGGGTSNHFKVKTTRYLENSAILVLNEHPRGLLSNNIRPIKSPEATKSSR